MIENISLLTTTSLHMLIHLLSDPFPDFPEFTCSKFLFNSSSTNSPLNPVPTLILSILPLPCTSFYCCTYFYLGVPEHMWGPTVRRTSHCFLSAWCCGYNARKCFSTSWLVPRQLGFNKVSIFGREPQDMMGNHLSL